MSSARLPHPPALIPSEHRETATLQGRAALPRGSDSDEPLSAAAALAVAIGASFLWLFSSRRRLRDWDALSLESFCRSMYAAVASGMFLIHSHDIQGA